MFWLDRNMYGTKGENRRTALFSALPLSYVLGSGEALYGPFPGDYGPVRFGIVLAIVCACSFYAYGGMYVAI